MANEARRRLLPLPGGRSAPSGEATVAKLYEEFSSATLAFFRSKLRDESCAADLNQELYIRLARSLENYRGECSWRTWIFAIARIVIADFRRERYRSMAHLHVTLDAAEFSEQLALHLDANDVAERVLLRHRLLHCLRKLDELGRAVIVGHYFSGITLRELTEKLALDNASGSRALLIASQRKLRRCLSRKSP